MSRGLGDVYKRQVPTVWDGKILSPDEAFKRVDKIGWDKFPSYATEQEAEQRYQQLHSFMERDTQQYFAQRGAGGATPFEAARLDMAEKLLTNMQTELKKDPLGWADRVGLVKLAPLDLSSPENATASLRARIGQAEAVAAHEGVAPQYLRPDEVTSLTAAMADGGPQTLAVAQAIAAGGGDRTPKILAELSKQAPALSMLAGLTNAAGLTPAARDAADGMALMKTPDGRKLVDPLMPKEPETREASLDVVGNALTRMPGAEAAALTLAKQIYAVRALRQGKTIFDSSLYEGALAEALGQQDVGGETYGGVIDQSGWFSGAHKIVLPPNVKQSSWRQTLDAITPEDLANAGLGNPVGGDGKPIPLERLKNMTLVQMPGLGRYAVTADDGAAPGEENFVSRDKPGQLFILDLPALTPMLARRRPDLFLGGAPAEAP